MNNPESIIPSLDELQLAGKEICFSNAPWQKCTDTAHGTFTPMHYEKGYSYPLVIWLHGSEGNQNQLHKVMPLVSMRNFVAIGPCGTKQEQHTSSAYTWQQTADQIEEAAERVIDCVAIARQQFNIHPDRIFLAGYESGGTMALRIALNHPELFAGVASIGGKMPTGHRPLSRLAQARQLPLLLSSCANSTIYPVNQVDHDLRLIHSAGFSVSVRQYPCDDELTTQMLTDLNAWLMEQTCSKVAIC